MEILIVGLIVIAIMALMTTYLTLSWGFVATKVYAWFILSIFPMAPQLTLLHFIGIILFLGVLMPRASTHIKEEYRDKQAATISFIIAPWLTLVICYFVHLFY
jgi:hypothetical protein